jgi:hypothetical protein
VLTEGKITLGVWILMIAVGLASLVKYANHGDHTAMAFQVVIALIGVAGVIQTLHRQRQTKPPRQR